MDSSTLLVILIIANAPVYYWFWRMVFGDWQTFVDCVRLWLTPNIVSVFRGETEDDWLSTMKLWWWLLLCGFVVALEYTVIDRFFLR